MFILASSVCKYLQCLISTLTQGGKGGHLFRLTCSVVLWGGRSTANKYTGVWGECSQCLGHTGFPLLTACVLPQSTLLRLQIALQGNCLKWALGCVHFPGLSHSGSGSWVLHKGTDSVGHAFCALPRSKQLRQAGAWQVHCPRWTVHLNHLSSPGPLVSRVCRKSAISGVPCVSSGEVTSGCDPLGRCQPARIPERLG